MKLASQFICLFCGGVIFLFITNKNEKAVQGQRDNRNQLTLVVSPNTVHNLEIDLNNKQIKSTTDKIRNKINKIIEIKVEH